MAAGATLAFWAPWADAAPRTIRECADLHARVHWVSPLYVGREHQWWCLWRERAGSDFRRARVSGKDHSLRGHVSVGDPQGLAHYGEGEACYVAGAFRIFRPPIVVRDVSGATLARTEVWDGGVMHEGFCRVPIQRTRVLATEKIYYAEVPRRSGPVRFTRSELHRNGWRIALSSGSPIPAVPLPLCPTRTQFEVVEADIVHRSPAGADIAYGVRTTVVSRAAIDAEVAVVASLTMRGGSGFEEDVTSVSRQIAVVAGGRASSTGDRAGARQLYAPKKLGEPVEATGFVTRVTPTEDCREPGVPGAAPKPR